MRTTIDIPDQLFREAKAHAALRGQTLKEFMEEGVRLALGQQTMPESTRVSFPIIPAGTRTTITAEEVKALIQQSELEDDRRRAGLD
jgi:hypothetical protein